MKWVISLRKYFPEKLTIKVSLKDEQKLASPHRETKVGSGYNV